LAATLSDALAALGAGAGVEAEEELLVAGGVAASLEELVVLDELPQPATASTPAATASHGAM
jgi:hypothetical protein